MYQPKIKLYKYYFKQLDKPIVMEAESRKSADDMLRALNEKMGGGMRKNDIIDLRIETLVVGESSKIRKGIKHIWVGLEFSQNGWITEDEYLNIVINNKKQTNERKKN